MKSCWSVLSPKYYDIFIDCLLKSVCRGDRKLMIKQQDNHFKNILNAKRRLHHLEIGCGTGVMLERSKYNAELKKYAKIVLCDIEPIAIEFTRDRLIKNGFDHNNIHCLPELDLLNQDELKNILLDYFENNDLKYFDTIQIQNVLHCLPDYCMAHKLTLILNNLQPYFSHETSIFGTFVTNNYSNLGLMGKILFNHAKKKQIMFVNKNGADQIDCNTILKQYFNSFSVYNINNNDPFTVQFQASNMKRKQLKAFRNKNC